MTFRDPDSDEPTDKAADRVSASLPDGEILPIVPTDSTTADTANPYGPAAFRQGEFDQIHDYAWQAFRQHQRRRLWISVLLFVLTFCSTTFVGGTMLGRLPVRPLQPITAWDIVWEMVSSGFTYSGPLMFILLCHEMGHFLQALRYRIPASFPYFIPLPIPPLGTMGAVILQGRGTADRRQMFDIAVSGPIAGMVATMPFLIYGIYTTRLVQIPPGYQGVVFGDPLLIKWMVSWIHGAAAEGREATLNGFLFAGWVGVFITALNLLPIGQLDGGHILYTLIGKKAHWVAMSLIALAVASMLYTGQYSYVLLLVLLMLTGPRHPPTADDTVQLGFGRIIVGWLTLAFLFIGFTLRPIVILEGTEKRVPPVRPQPQRAIDPNQLAFQNAHSISGQTAVHFADPNRQAFEF